MLDLDRLDSLAEAATPGPWRWQEHKNDDGSPAARMFLDAVGRDYGHVLKITWPELLKDKNADFIASVDPQTVLALTRIARAARALTENGDVWSVRPADLSALRKALASGLGPVLPAELDSVAASPKEET